MSARCLAGPTLKQTTNSLFKLNINERIKDRRTEAVEVVARRRAQHAVAKEQQRTRSYEQRRRDEAQGRWAEHAAKAEHWRGLGRYELLRAADAAAERSRVS